MGRPVNLFDPGPPSAESLTGRQQLALRLVRTTEGGCTAELVGAAVHRQYGKRPCPCSNPELPACQWAASTGTELLGALRSKGYGLVRRRGTGLWEIPGTTPKPGHSGPGELPEGF